MPVLFVSTTVDPIIYLNPAPDGAVTVISPVAMVQDGCTTVTVDLAGVLGTALITITESGLIQPAAVLTVT